MRPTTEFSKRYIDLGHLDLDLRLTLTILIVKLLLGFVFLENIMSVCG